eukprot:2175-Heterococcus_DN1.PRE.4
MLATCSQLLALRVYHIRSAKTGFALCNVLRACKWRHEFASTLERFLRKSDLLWRHLDTGESLHMCSEISSCSVLFGSARMLCKIAGSSFHDCTCQKLTAVR